MTSSLVGSEMCIRDSFILVLACELPFFSSAPGTVLVRGGTCALLKPCLLYTSDAADDMQV
eukprot:5614305-Prorocentrum_lima.AAC.1